MTKIKKFTENTSPKAKDKYLTVGKMKELLNKYQDDMLIGAIGHFGEFMEMTDFDVSSRKSYLTNGSSWRNRGEEVTVVELTVPEKGPEPD